MILTKEHKIVLSTLAGTPLAKKFYWTGGTLLSHYYLHHRKSFDLDFFSDTEFSYEDLTGFLAEVKQKLHIDSLRETRIYDRWEFVLPSTPPLRFEFVHYNHEKKRLSPLTSYMGLSIDSLPDLAANKVMAYIDRNQPKDLFDVYTLIVQKKFTVRELLSMVKRKFGAEFPPLLFWSESAKGLKQLDTLKPYLLEPDEKKQEELLKTVKYFFLDRGKAFLKQQLG